MQLRRVIETEQPSDRVIIVFVFLPLLRHEIDTFIHVHNAHRIREQGMSGRGEAVRDGHKPGVPNELYFGKDYILKNGFDQPRPTQGFKPNPVLLERQQRLFADYDDDAIFDLETSMWLLATMHAVGKSEPPRADEFIQQIPKPDFSVPEWFRNMIDRGREHMASDEGPTLRFAPLPDTGRQWVAAHQRIIEEELFNVSFDTMGMDEADAEADGLASDDAYSTDTESLGAEA